MQKMKYILLLVLLIVFTNNTFSQSNFINYQGLASDSNGAIIQNTTINIAISLKFGSATAVADYEETHSVTTDNHGVFSLQIGNGTVISGVYNDLTWNTNAFVTIAIDGTEIGTSELHAVPFALNSGDSVWEKNGDIISNTNLGNVGIGTTNPNGKLDVRGDIWLGTQDNGTYKIGKYINNIQSSNYIEFGASGSPIDNYIKFHTHLAGDTNQDIMMLSGNGNVGIGTNTPTAKLEVVNNSGNDIVRIGDGTDWGILELDGSGSTNSEIRQGSSTDGLQIWAGDQQEFWVNADATAKQAMKIETSGNIGIGTATPNAKLHIDNSDNATTWSTQVTTGNSSGLLVDGTNIPATNRVLQISNGPNTEMVVLGNGNVGIGTTTPNVKLDVKGVVNVGTAAEGVLTYDATKFIVKANNGTVLSLGANGQNDNMIITTNGDVGIGTTTPAAKLDIDGTIKSTGINLNGVLKTDWTSPKVLTLESSTFSSTTSASYSNIGTPHMWAPISFAIALGGTSGPVKIRHIFQVYTNTTATISVAINNEEDGGTWAEITQSVTGVTNIDTGWVTFNPYNNGRLGSRIKIKTSAGTMYYQGGVVMVKL